VKVSKLVEERALEP